MRQLCNCFITVLELRERARVLLIFSLERHFPLLIEILDRCVFQEVANKYLALDPVRWEPMQIFSKVVVQGGFDKELFTEVRTVIGYKHLFFSPLETP